MGSRSSERVSSSTENTIIDRRLTQESGQQIVDSIIVDNSPEVVDAAMRNMIAGWETMVNSNSLNLLEVVQMGNSIIEMVDKSQVQMNETAISTLREGVEMFETMVGQNKLVLTLADTVAERSFDQSEKALDLIAEVKTGDFADLSKSIMVFALIALSISAWVVKEK